MKVHDNLSYAERVREEIYMSRPSKNAHYLAFRYGLLMMGKRFDERVISISTEHLTVSKLYGFAIKDTVGVRAAFTEHKTPRGNTLYSVALTDLELISRIMKAFSHEDGIINRELVEESELPQFLAGAFLACATISDPSKGYHMEFLPPNDEAADLLFELLSTIGYPPKSSVRRGQTVLYYKESEPIEDILAMIGAVKSSLSLMELKIYKDLRNRANRATNCETANIDKLIKTATKQIADIEYLEEKGLLDTLPSELKALAKLRVDHPDASLAELASLSGASRSGVNHRLKRIEQAAAEAREKG